MLVKPQRHRVTEKTQSHPPTSQTRRHEGTKTSQSHPATISNAKAQRRREALAGFLCVARPRPSDDGREPLGRATVPNTSVRHGVPAQRPALRERRPRRFSSPFNSWKGPLLPYRKEERQNRRAEGTAAGEKAGCDERSRSEQTDFSPGTGDFRSPVVLPPISRITSSAQRPPLRVFVSLCLRRGRVGGSVPSVPLWFIRCLDNAKTLSSLA